jgi:hypothetical protein
MSERLNGPILPPFSADVLSVEFSFANVSKSAPSFNCLIKSSAFFLASAFSSSEAF